MHFVVQVSKLPMTKKRKSRLHQKRLFNWTKCKKPVEHGRKRSNWRKSCTMEMLATQLLPFNLVDGVGFRQFKIVSDELVSVNKIALTADGWTSKDNRHSLISVTGHFLDQNFKPKFFVLSTKPIKGRHTAEAIVSFIREALNDFQIQEEKISALTHDTENTMKTVGKDLGFVSVDCAAHVLQLCIKEGLRSIEDEERLKNLLENVKRFVRKVRKSRVLTEQLAELQQKEEVPPTVLIKNVEVRWNSSYKMIERFIRNRSAVNLLSIEHCELPKFNADDWLLLSSIKNVLSPIYEATILLQNRSSSCSIIIPLFKAISFGLREDKDNRFSNIKKIIADAIELRLKQAEEQKT